jgi:hypothetical protein
MITFTRAGLYHGSYAGGLAAALIFGLTAARAALAEIPDHR